MARRNWFVVIAILALGGCTSEEGMPAGESIYRNPVADGNTFACATCHAIEEPTANGLRHPGHPIGDAARRATYKNGEVASLREAVNSCLEEWMAAEPWQEDDERWTSLRGWLESLTPATRVAEPVTVQIVQPPAFVGGGDPMAGQALFNRSCIVCHGLDGAGTERGPGVTGYGHAPEFVAKRIRTSGSTDSAVYDGLTGGRMPFWGADRLTDSEVLDLVAYVNTSAKPEGGMTGGGGAGGTARVCDATHPKIGQRTTLSERAHGVSGTARIVDDCTIDFENFNYDGTGIDVRAYGAKGGDYDAGFAISGNILGMPYSNGTLRVQLPIGKTLDHVDGVSIWCVAASFSFGDGLFAP